MTTYPRSPRVLKGAVIGVDLFNPLASVIVFQYNPSELTRRLDAQTPGQGQADRSEAMRLTGPPVETIDLKVEIDATDQLEKGDGLAGAMGIHPQLAALEMLLYPKSALVIANTVLAAAGTIELVPPEAPLTLLVWGASRVLPVRLTQFSITEEAFDPQLNPIRASVSLSLRVLSYSDLSLTHPGYYLFLAHQIMKETMATMGSAGNLGAVAGGEVKLF
ncbi:MAG: hypothetical protein EYC70_09050 [Planctomycetota bacterium]|nr:MAG: hypothetical protein EYC70_09050 [Planctomycetota bacterium]